VKSEKKEADGKNSAKINMMVQFLIEKVSFSLYEEDK